MRLTGVVAATTMSIVAMAAWTDGALAATARMVITPNPATVGVPVHFDGSASTGGVEGIGCPSFHIEEYRWDLDGDGTDDHWGETVDYTYDRGGGYNVTLYVEAAAWCSNDTETQLLSVMQPGGERPRNTAAPYIVGQAVVGEQLRAYEGSWTASGTRAFGFQWLRCDGGGSGCTAIAGAVHDTYAPSQSDVGRTLRVEVTAASSGGFSEPARSSQTASVSQPPPPPIIETPDSAAHDIEEHNDNYADRYIPPAVDDALIEPDPEAYADEAVCGSEGDSQTASCLPDPTVGIPASSLDGAPDPDVTCGEGCPVFYVAPGMSEEEIPQWVLDLDAYRDAAAEGIRTDATTYFGSGAAVAYYAASIEEGPKCPRRYVCLYQHSAFRTSRGTKGRHFRTNRVAFAFTLDDYGMKNRTSSWINRRTRNWACMDDLEDTTTSYRRMPPKSKAKHMGGFNDRADKFVINFAQNGSVCNF